MLHLFHLAELERGAETSGSEFLFGMGKEIQNNSLHCCSNSSKPTDFHRRPLHVLAFALVQNG